MEKTFVKMLKAVDEFEAGEVYEIDSETAQKWIDAELAEKQTDPAEKLQKKINESVSAAVDKLADSIKVEPREPVVNVVPEKKNLPDFVRLFCSDRPKLEAKYGKVLSVGTDTAVVPTPLLDEVLRSEGWKAHLESRCKIVPMSSNTEKVPVLDQANVSPTGGKSSYFGGIFVASDSEDDDANATEPAFATKTLTSERITGVTIQTLEFRQDSVYVEQDLVRDFAGAFNNYMDYRIIDDIIDNAATKVINRTTASRVKYADLVAMVAARASSAGNWAWVVGNQAFGDFLKLEDSGGTQLLSPGMVRELFGFPILVNEHCAALGTAGDVLLVNLANGYMVGDRMKYELSMSDDYGFLKSRRYIKLVARKAFSAVHASTITLADGSTTVGELIQLDDVSS
jgi:HK97 family phage major capsid protein